MKKTMKGMSNLDYAIAVGVFLIIFAALIYLTTNYFSSLRDTSKITNLRTEALTLLGIADTGYVPENWTTSDYPKRIGLGTKAYRFFILVNNTLGTDIENERVSFSYKSIGYFNADKFSTTIYDENNNTVEYSIQTIHLGEEIADYQIEFNTTINSGEHKWFTVYFDDDSNFTGSSAIISGTNNLTETVYPVEEINILQYRKIMKLNGSSYSAMKNSTMLGDFSITIYNSTNQKAFDFMPYGGTPPKASDVVALERNILYQNSTAGINHGKLIVKVW